MQPHDEKEVFWLSGEVKSPPFSLVARLEAGRLLGLLQKGVLPGMPHARPMPSIGKRCLELRIPDETVTWRIICRADPDAILVAEVFSKKTQTTPRTVIDVCKARFSAFDKVRKEATKGK